jgi:hypothetical protein
MTSDHLLAAVLSGAVDASDIERHGAAALLAAARAHDVVPLTAERLQRVPGLNPESRSVFDVEAHRATAADLAREAELRRLLAALSAAGIEALLIKGSHLAYSCYSRPDLRARIDTDLLIARADRERADAVLTRQLGYVADSKPSGDLTATQKLYVLTRNEVDVHLVDLHWRLASPQVFAHVLSFEELRARALPLPALGAAAYGPAGVHALLIACMHRVAHHHDEADQFKWLYDIHLIASTLTDADWRGFADLAVDREIGAVTRESLERSRVWFGTPVPDSVHNDSRLVTAAQREGTAAFLRVRPKAHEVMDDFRALSSWRDRVRLAREHLFPSAAYMRTIYAPASRWPLPLLYLRRIGSGAGAWLKAR